MRFISITKPGIIFGNIITVSGGFFLGSQGEFHFWRFLATLLGMCFIIAAGCVFNNYIDRDIDQLMERTKNRVLAQGRLSGKIAISYAILLTILGSLILYFAANSLTLIVGLVGLFVYVVVYSLYMKRKSTFGATLGGIAGAVPPVAGYCAATNRFDMGAIILFFILFLWQMPHFYAISIYRLKDFASASLPILPLKKSMQYTKTSMFWYVVAFTIVSILPSFFGYTGIIYFIIALLLGLTWLYLGFQGFKAKDDRIWARKMFIFSIINITLLCVFMSVHY